MPATRFSRRTLAIKGRVAGTSKNSAATGTFSGTRAGSERSVTNPVDLFKDREKPLEIVSHSKRWIVFKCEGARRAARPIVVIASTKA